MVLGAGEAAGIAEFCRDGQGREIVDAAEAPQAADAGAQRFEIQQGAQLRFDSTELSEPFIDRTQVGAMGLLQGGQRPRLGPQPRVMPLRPRLLGGGEAAAVTEEELREAVPRAEQIGADVFPTAQQIPCRFLLLGRM